MPKNSEYHWTLEVYCEGAETVEDIESRYNTRPMEGTPHAVQVVTVSTPERCRRLIAELEATPGVNDVMCDTDLERAWN
jgi:hypothetical protein